MNIEGLRVQGGKVLAAAMPKVKVFDVRIGSRKKAGEVIAERLEIIRENKEN